MIKQPKSANHELSIFTAFADPVETDVADVETIAAVPVPVTVLVFVPGKTQVHVCAKGQLVGPAVPTHVVVWPVQVLIGQYVKVWSMVVASPVTVFAFRHCQLVMLTDERDPKICLR